MTVFILATHAPPLSFCHGTLPDHVDPLTE